MTDTPSAFLITSQYKRFAELCNNSLNSKSINLCYGKPGVGKTESAQHYAKWLTVDPLLSKSSSIRGVPADLVNCSTALFTPDVTVTPRKLQAGIALLRNRFDHLIEQAFYTHDRENWAAHPRNKHLRLLIVDEADRLKFQSLELLRDIYDRGNVSIILMGMPGIDRRLKRFGQLHSRFSFAYEMLPLNKDEMRLFISQKWLELKLPLTADDGVSAAIMRIANGNFRVLHRIFTEVERLQKLNCLPMITPDLVEVARQGLLLGTT